MFTLTEEQRKQLLQYMWQRPYGEVAQHIVKSGKWGGGQWFGCICR